MLSRPTAYLPHLCIPVRTGPLRKMLAKATALARGGAVLQAALLFSAMTLSHAQIQTVHEYAVPSGQFSQPVRIIVGPDGALWFTDNTNARIGRITTAGAITSFAVPATSSGWGITVGPDGALWFTAKDQIGRMTTTCTRSAPRHRLTASRPGRTAHYGSRMTAVRGRKPMLSAASRPMG